MTRIAYLDCSSGISGDMTLGALVDAGVDLAKLDDAVRSLGLPGCRLVVEEVRKAGFRATQIMVKYEPEHVHRHLSHICDLIDGSQLTPSQKGIARKIFTRLAEAEAKVHGTTIDKVHFHEVGAADSIADIVGAAVGWDLLGVDRIVASPVPTGTGTAKIAHGRTGIPAPATAELLCGIPLAESSIRCELTTPTGAAILATLADAFGPLPAMTVEQIGYGAGQRDLAEQPNVLRLMVGEAVADAPIADTAAESDQIAILETNLDDIPGEVIGYCIERLWEAGALDVYTTAIGMKKNRPGVKLTVLCRGEDVERVEAVLFAETTTLGVRRWTAARHVLSRRPHQVETPFGPVDGKLGWLADGLQRFAPEYESCRQIAADRGVPLRDVYEAAHAAFEPEETDRGGRT